MTKQGDTHLQPTIVNLGVHNLETSILKFFARMPLRDEKMEAEIVPLELGTKFCCPDTATGPN
jgi:hypothetical protein